MKKTLLPFLLAILLLTSACASAPGADRSDHSESLAQSEAATPDWLALYAPRLTAYQTVLQEEIDGSLAAELGINYICNRYFGEGKALESIGYALFDVDRDGTPELLIGVVAEGDIFYSNMLLDVYTLNEQGEVKQLISSQERDRYDLQEDGSFYNSSSGGASRSAYCIYRLENGALTQTDGVKYDSELDPPFLLWNGGEWLASNQEDYTARADSLQRPVQEIQYVPFSAYVTPET